MHGSMNVKLQEFTSLSSVNSNLYKFITPLGVIGEIVNAYFEN